MLDVWFAALLAGVVVWQSLGVLAYMAIRIVTKRGRHDG